MPSYNVECSKCGHDDTLETSTSAVDAWDARAICPSCNSGDGQDRRVMRFTPAGYGGAKAQAKSASSKKADQKAHFVSSGAKDDMRHRESKTRDKDQVREAVDN